jgi:hypothetical protein
MGGRFGKYGDAKRKALIRKNRLRPPGPRQPKKDKSLKWARKSKAGVKIEAPCSKAAGNLPGKER